ncbi:MAG: response regulator [Flavisolibacter sp.]
MVSLIGTMVKAGMMSQGLGFSILIVEDDEDDRIIIDEAFMSMGFGAEVKKFINAVALFHYLEQVEQSLFPCLIVIDNTLPKLNATDILSWLKSNVRYQKIPVVIYSTVLSDALKKQLISAGAYACFEKGNSMQQIMDTEKTLKALAEGVRENS